MAASRTGSLLAITDWLVEVIGWHRGQCLEASTSLLLDADTIDRITQRILEPSNLEVIRWLMAVFETASTSGGESTRVTV